MIRAVLFDLDGTLLNREDSVKVFIERQYDKFYSYLNHIPRETYISRFIELEERGYVWKDKVFQQLVSEFGVTGLKWECLLRDYIQSFKDCCKPFSGLIEMLEKLKSMDLSLGIISNGYGDFQMNSIRSLGIERYFNVILISEWEGMKKPDIRLFKKASDNLNVTPAECIFLGDHPWNDVQAAVNSGMHGVWKKDDGWGECYTEHTIQHLKEFPAIISKLNKQVRDIRR
ncbi:HAD family hydrolase [Metabacillus indicus]|uniref:HAD family hydrolase n=1 Tax=Metabacillus indicus TaxID=246786 RepID=UPI000493870D|nr:HAD family hydrolase [Metabacillus indicus]KEZ50568.1 L-2-haloalkanoic acid dehalogenase [Metabacillus indicus LMG 22858]